MAVRISGAGSISGLTDWEATSVTHPNSGDTNITLVDDGSVVFDFIPADIQSAIDAAGNAGIGSNVVSTILTSPFSASVGAGNTTAITGLTATITPTSASSKILVLYYVTGVLNLGNANRSFGTILLRGATQIAIGDAAGSRRRVGSASASTSFWGASNTSVVVLDSPATASPVTYSIRMHNGESNARTLFVNRTGDDGNRAEASRQTSAITLIEVSA